MVLKRGAIRVILCICTVRKFEPIEGCYSLYFAFLYCYRKMDIKRVVIHAILHFCTFRKFEPIEGCYSCYFAFLYF